MNEQLIVKNFGPIKDATVDFKRVTVFIGPTGGGKSTLAKLAMLFRGGEISLKENGWDASDFYSKHRIESFPSTTTDLSWRKQGQKAARIGGNSNIPIKIWFSQDDTKDENGFFVSEFLEKINEPNTDFLEGLFPNLSKKEVVHFKTILSSLSKDTILSSLIESTKSSEQVYFPADRLFIPAVEYSWAGLLRDDIGLPKDTLDFANNFSLSRKNISKLDISFLNVKYIHRNGQDFIKVPNVDTLFRLYETASGIQSVTPLLVLLEHLSRNTEQAQSFIIEEPELNLFPLAQFELVKILVEKCAQTEGKNDLVLTTHSPYVLTALNLLCYAYRIAQQDEATAKKVAKLIPRHCWIDPDQFAAYYVDRPDTKRKQQVRSIINKKTGLIEENELDTASDELGTIFDKLVRLRKPTSTHSRAK
jgi:predicted ATPase